MTKGMVLPHEIKPAPKYRVFCDYKYHNPQTDPIFILVQEEYKDKGGWFNCYDYIWEIDLETGKEITLLKIAEPTAKILFELSANMYIELK